MKETLKLTVSLGLICAVAAAVLAYVHKATKPAQEAAALKERQANLQLVLPPFDNNPLEKAVTLSVDGRAEVTFYPATLEGRLVAFAAEGSTEKGYGGALNVLVGLDPEGTVRAVVVSEHSETPGLGTQVTDRKRTAHIGELFSGKDAEDEAEENPLPPSEYLDQYTGRNLADTKAFSVTADGGRIEPVSGATVSSRAVADAVDTVAAAFRENREALRRRRP